MTPTRSLPRSAAPALAALLDGEVAGWVRRAGNGRLSFRYEESWRAREDAYPLSLSMPPGAADHGHHAVSAYLWGLLPDNPSVLEWWARNYQTSPWNVVGLLTHVGEDCAGAVQFARPERVGALLGPPAAFDEEASMDWITQEEIADRLRELRINPAVGRLAGDIGQFSLAGAQAKTALYEAPDGRWGVPRGRVPTNRILKPPMRELAGISYTEHWCLELARALDLPAARSRVQHFGHEVAIVVERYDRVRIGGVLVRLHQEDVCQALAVNPTRKYESEGGPGIARTIALLRERSDDPGTDVSRFLDAVAFNWLIGATDAHAKNYSLLHVRGPRTRLAPLYDVISVLPYPHLVRGGAALAMAVGGERKIEVIDGTHWRAEARSLALDPDALVERVNALGSAMPLALQRLEADATPGTEAFTALAHLRSLVDAHVRACLARL